MNKDIKEIYVAIHNNKAVYANTNLQWFIDGMKALEPNIYSRQTLKTKLSEDGVAYFTGKLGTHYVIYKYPNPNYRGLTRVRKKKT